MIYGHYTYSSPSRRGYDPSLEQHTKVQDRNDRIHRVVFDVPCRSSSLFAGVHAELRLCCVPVMSRKFNGGKVIYDHVDVSLTSGTVFHRLPWTFNTWDWHIPYRRQQLLPSSSQHVPCCQSSTTGRSCRNSPYSGRRPAERNSDRRISNMRRRYILKDIQR